MGDGQFRRLSFGQGQLIQFSGLLMFALILVIAGFYLIGRRGVRVMLLGILQRASRGGCVAIAEFDGSHF